MWAINWGMETGPGFYYRFLTTAIFVGSASIVDKSFKIMF